MGDNEDRQIGFPMAADQDVDSDESQINQERDDDQPPHHDVESKYEKASPSLSPHRDVDYKDEKGHNPRDRFIINARELNIVNSNEPKYWQWMNDSDGTEVAKVVNTKWLEVRGSFWTMNLSLNGHYQVSFWTRMEEMDSSTMRGQMVNLKLILPDGTYQERQAELPGVESRDDGLYELEVGQFTLTAQKVGKMEFCMENLFGSWRSGLVIRCVEIKACDRK